MFLKGKKQRLPFSVLSPLIPYSLSFAVFAPEPKEIRPCCVIGQLQGFSPQRGAFFIFLRSLL